MLEQERWNYICDLDDDFLQGGVVLSEWAAFLVRDADLSYASGANLACVITALSAIETHLRYENRGNRKRLVDLINDTNLDPSIKDELHLLRKYRNGWVHVSSPDIDEEIINQPSVYERDLEYMAKRCLIALRRVLYANQFI